MGIELYVATNGITALPRVRPFAGEPGDPLSAWPLAQELIEEGVEGLRTVEMKLQAVSPIPGSSVRSVFLQEHDVVARNLRLNQAAVVMGTAVQAINDVLTYGRFSELHLITRYNASIGNSELGLRLTPQTPDLADIDPDARKRLQELAEQDKSLSVFFAAANFNALPEGLRRLLKESGTLDDIRLQIAPAYRERFRESKLILKVRPWRESNPQP